MIVLFCVFKFVLGMFVCLVVVVSSMLCVMVLVICMWLNLFGMVVELLVICMFMNFDMIEFSFLIVDVLRFLFYVVVGKFFDVMIVL